MPKQDRAVRTPAIILRRRDIAEADLLLTILTPHHGKLDVVAHGARKALSRKTGHVELFSMTDMLVNKHRAPGTVSQVELIEPFLPLRENLLLGGYASYAVELLDEFTRQGDDDTPPALFDLLRDTLARLCAAPDKRLVLRFYEMRLLDLAGFRPELGVCVYTGEPIRPENQFFSFAEGGAVSYDVGTRKPNLAGLSFHALKLMRHLQRSTWQQVAALTLKEELHREVEALMVGYVSYTLEAQLHSVEFIRRLRRLLNL